MDPVKKTFEEAFSGYEIPVREDLWKQVQAKRQKPARKMWPLLRVAAAAAIVIVAVSLFWQRNQPLETDQPIVNTPVEQSTNKLPETENTTPEINEPAVMPAHEEIASETSKTSERKLSAPAMQKAPKQEQIIKTFPAQEMANEHHTPQLIVEDDNIQTLHPKEEIALEEKAMKDDKEMAHVDVQVELTPLPIPPKPMTEQKSNQQRHRAEVLNELKPVLTDRNKTGPERLLAAFERVKPKVVDDLIAFGNRHTEIEITW